MARKTMERMTKWVAAMAVAAVATVLGSGCASSGGGGRDVTVQVPPNPDGYYTGESHDYAGRFNPDPRGRKFRVAYLRISPKTVEASVSGENLKTEVGKHMDSTFHNFMEFREQARESVQASMVRTGDDAEEAKRENQKNWFQMDDAILKQYVQFADGASLKPGPAVRAGHGASFILANPLQREFVRHRADLGYINAELASRYPAVFTADADGFPLDVVLACICTTKLPVLEPRFEAWVIGMPEHALQPKGNHMLPFMPAKPLFRSVECFLSPYDAIAAALFGLTDEQFEGLEAANPRDHEWLGGK